MYLITALIVVVGLNFYVVFLLNSKHIESKTKINPARETLSEFFAINKELNLLWNKKSNIFKTENFSNYNRLRGIVDVEFPNLANKVYLLQDDLKDQESVLKVNQQVILLSQEISKLSNSIINKSKFHIGSDDLVISDYKYEKLNELSHTIANKIMELRLFYDELSKQSEDNLAKNVQFISISTSVVALLVIIFFVYIAKNTMDSILNPIKALQSKLDEVGKGIYGEEIEKQSSEEFNHLGRSFNEMNASLNKSFKELQQKNKDLEALSKKLKDSNEQLEEFAYIASHDLKSPIRNMSNLATFIEEDYAENLDETGKGFLDNIKQQAQRMTNLVDDLLVYSRVNKMEVPTNKVDLKSIVEEASELLEIPKDENIQLNVKELPSLVVDPVKIKTVFINLLTNAIKYNDSSVKIIDIWSEGSTIYIKDNGIGIDAENHKKIFKFFRRLHAKDEYGGGTGAGMAIVKKVLDRHKATIEVESELGKGTTFIIKFSTQNTNLQ